MSKIKAIKQTIRRFEHSGFTVSVDDKDSNSGRTQEVLVCDPHKVYLHITGSAFRSFKQECHEIAEQHRMSLSMAYKYVGAIRLSNFLQLSLDLDKSGGQVQ